MDTVQLAALAGLLIALSGLVAAISQLVLAFRALHVQLNARLDQQLELTKELAHQLGVAEGKAASPPAP